jgi:ethanolamine permease
MTGGWGGMLVAGIIIGIMYLGLVFCIAEMSPALPHTGAAYSFARTAMGPWGGFVTGLFENVEYVIAPAVICTFVAAIFASVVGLDPAFYPVLWAVLYAIFLALNIYGVALSYRVTLAVTVISLLGLVAFWFVALSHFDFSKMALNIGAGPDGKPVELPEGNGPLFPFGFSGVLATLPFAVWLFLAIEQVPLAAEESVDPKKDLPRGIILGMLTLIVSAFMIVLVNPSIIGVGSFALGSSLEPVVQGARAVLGQTGAVIFGVIALIGLIASFHTILYAQGRQVYSLSRAGYFPSALSVTHATYKTPHVAMILGAVVGFVVMLVIWYANGGGGPGPTQLGDDLIGSVMLNMAVFGAMLSYIAQAASFILLRRNQPNIERPYRSPFGIPGAVVTIIIALVTLGYQVLDPNFLKGVIWVIVWLAVGVAYFALVGRNRLILSPEEEFALAHKAK